MATIKELNKVAHQVADNLGWTLKYCRDKNHSDADVVVWRQPMMMATLGEIIIVSDVSYEECLKEYKSYWEYIIYRVDRSSMVDYTTIEYDGKKYYALVD